MTGHPVSQPRITGEQSDLIAMLMAPLSGEKRDVSFRCSGDVQWLWPVNRLVAIGLTDCRVLKHVLRN